MYFGTMPDGKRVNSFTLRNKNGMSISAINYGGIITSICVPDKNGVYENVVLGFDNLNDYLSDTCFIGAIIGRCANRIADASFILDGKQYNLVKNDGNNSLHGGKKGFNTKWWNIQEKTVREGQALRLSASSLDGEEGYPGKANMEVLYILTNNNELIIKYFANSTKKTIINLTNHSYFNLSAGRDCSVENHKLQIKTNYFAQINSNLIPTGEFVSVENSPLDFRVAKPIKDGIDLSHEQTSFANGIDHSFVVPTSKDYVVHYEDEQSGRILEITTGEPSIQIYSGNYLPQPHSGIAFETQHFPDSIHHKNFPSVVLNPGATYMSETKFAFFNRDDMANH